MAKEGQKYNKKGSEAGKIWLKKQLKPVKKQVAFLTALSVCTTVLSVAFAFFVRYLVNGATQKNQNALLLFSILLGGLLLTRVLFQALHQYFAEQFRAKFTITLRARLFERALFADYEQLERYHSGDLLNRLTTDVYEVAADTASFLPTAVGMATQATGAIIALCFLDWLFTLILVGACAFACAFVALCRKKYKKAHRAMVEADGESRAFIQESESSVIAIKAYGAEQKTAKKAQGILSRYFKKRMSCNLLRTGIQNSFSLLSGLGTVFALIWCGVGILNGEGDYGVLFSVVLLLGQLQRPVTAFSGIMPLYYARETAAERLCEIDFVSSEQDLWQKAEGKLLSVIAEDLSFSYGKENLPVFQGVNLNFPLQKSVCITGESGSGKSTLFKLLLSVYKPTAGKLFIQTEQDGVVKTQAVSARCRGYFAYVPQGNFLFSGTIRENLTFFLEGEASVGEEELKRALEIACATFVYELPKGLDTPLKERGAGLSEGQIQRLAVARALLSNRQVLLLDEATSALDSATEAQLLENLNREGKACIIVTHRPAALENADTVLTVKEENLVKVK